MKKIEILQTGIRPIIMFDDDQTPLTEYTKNISSLLRSANVSILETSTGNTILRPQHIYSVIIEDAENKNLENSVKESIDIIKTPKKEIQEDIITG